MAPSSRRPAAVVAVVLAAARLAQRQSVQYVFSSVVATALAAYFALRSGRAEDAFLPGIAINAAYAAGTLLSVLTRWPLVGFLVGAGTRRRRPIRSGGAGTAAWSPSAGG